MFDFNDPRFPRASHGVLIVDNYDSFTFNLAHYVAEVTGVMPTVVRNDDAELLADAELHRLDHLGTDRADRFFDEYFGQFAAVIVSPGPGTPHDDVALGISARAVSLGSVPVLGVCLGMQAQIRMYGGRVGRAHEARHGRISPVTHDGQGLFAGLPSPLNVVRYHSLVALEVPEVFAVDAVVAAIPESGAETETETVAEVVMAIKHEAFPQWGVQFHPESLCTEGGRRIVANFLDLATAWNRDSGRMGALEPVAAGEARAEYRAHVEYVASAQARHVRGRGSNDAATPPLRPASPVLSLEDADPVDAFFGATDMPPSSVAPAKLELRVASRTLDDSLRGVEAERLFADSFLTFEQCAWLDASSDDEERGRFSIMAAADGSLARVLEYRVGHYDAQGRVAALDHGVIRDGSGRVLLEGECKFFETLSRDLDSMNCVEAEGISDLPFAFRPGWVGSLGYELKSETGAGHPSDTTSPARDDLPDAALFFAARALVIDHVQRTAYALWVETPRTEGAVDTEGAAGTEGAADTEGAVWAEGILRSAAAAASRETTAGTVPFKVRPEDLPSQVGRPTLQHDRTQYLALIERAQEAILAGDTYEVCLTNEVRMEWSDDKSAQSSAQRSQVAFAAHRALRAASPSHLGVYFRFGEHCLVSSSPERFVRVTSAGVAESSPIKGTRPRGATPDADAELRRDLETSEKDRSENLMIVDLVRHDLGQVAEPGEVHVSQEFQVETFATVHQLVSTVQAKVRYGFTAADVVRAVFPGGSMTGAPKISTMKIISDLERRRRGTYSGGVGYFGVDGAADLAMVIRSLVFAPTGVSLGVGGAIIALSDPVDEFNETAVKASAALSALGLTSPFENL